MKNRLIKTFLFIIFIVLIFFIPIYSILLFDYSEYQYEDETNKLIYMRKHFNIYEEAFQQFRFPVFVKVDGEREFLAIKVSDDEEYWYSNRFEYLYYNTEFYNETYQQVEIAEIILSMSQKSVSVTLYNHGSTFCNYIAPDFITPIPLHGGDDGYIEADQLIKCAISAEKLLELYEKGLHLQEELEQIYDEVTVNSSL